MDLQAHESIASSIIMRNFPLILISLFLISCATPPHIEGELRYSQIHKSTVKLDGINYPEQLKADPVNLFNNLSDGLFRGWPDIILVKPDDKTIPDYYLTLNVLGYESTHNQTKRKETVDNETVHYKIYQTLTFLKFDYQLKENNSNSIVLTRTVVAKNITENKEQDFCASGNILDNIACEVLIKPIIDGTINLILSPLGEHRPENKYEPPTAFEEMLYYAGREIGKSLPEPYCSSDGIMACTSYFFRNTLQK